MIAVRRGDLIIGVAKGNYFGRARPSIVVQADRYHDLASVLVCPTTTDLRVSRPMRVRLKLPKGRSSILSDVMVDKMLPMPRDQIGRVICRLPPAQMRLVEAALAAMLGLPMRLSTTARERR